MRKFFPLTTRDAGSFGGLILLWLVAYKSADVFNFFATYSSLWFLPAGVTLSIAMAAPLRLVLAPLVANLLLAIPLVCWLLGIEFTTFRDPILHSFRLFIIYAGAGLVARFWLRLTLPIADLKDQLALIVVTIIASALGALSGVSLHASVGTFPWSVAWEILLPWAVGDAIGAMIVPPLLVPLLLWMFGPRAEPVGFLPWRWVVFQLIAILAAMIVSFWVPQHGLNLGSLWYVILLPPIIFAVRGGLPAAALATALTAMLTPPAAYLLGFAGERTSLQFLLLITASVSLMIGSAITDRKQAYLRLKQSEEGLEQQVKERTKELSDAYVFQQNLMRSIGHDLRQPVQSINMMLDGLVIQHRDSPSLPPLAQARSIGRNAAEFITKVLDYAKRDAGRVQLMAEDIPLQSVFDQVGQTFQAHASAREVCLVIEPTDIRLITDPNLLWDVLSNLVQNAIQLSGPGQTVRMKAETADDGLKISVVDEIEGSCAVSGQAGFGLEIVRQLSRLLGAEFSSEPNSALICLPMQKNEPAPQNLI